MVPIAWRNLFEDKLRLVISIGGVALSIMLVLLLNGFLAGTNRQITTYVDNTPADFYVSQKGIANFLMGTGSVIPRSTLERIEGVEGITSATPVFAQYAILGLHDKKVTTFLVGYEPSRGGGPWRLSAGRGVETNDEVVVDRVLAQRHGLRLGEGLDVLGRRFRIVGFSDDTASFMISLIFVRHDAATALRRADGTTSFILVNTRDGAAATVRLKEALSGLSVVRPETIAKNDVSLVSSAYTILLRVMVVIAIGIGAMLVGLTIYSATAERVVEYGVLKAMGMPNGRLYAIVARQALGAAVLGLGAGFVLVWLVATGIQRVWPQFLLDIDQGSILQAAVGAVAMALLASLLPARYLGNVDPASIFRR